MPLWEDRAKVTVAGAARGYLDANCAHCHNPAGSASNSGLYLRWEQTDPIAIGIGKRPVAAGRGAGGHESSIIARAIRTNRSCYYRIASLRGGVAMPEVGRRGVGSGR